MAIWTPVFNILSLYAWTVLRMPRSCTPHGVNAKSLIDNLSPGSFTENACTRGHLFRAVMAVMPSLGHSS
jgi:hypothetical protein